MNKLLLLILVLVVILLTALFTLISNPVDFSKQAKEDELGTAINQAKFIYNSRKEQKIDFSKGPCLSNALQPGWVLDIAHSPRKDLDDLPENLCPSFIEGKATHFVELDPEGNLIRAE